MNRSKLEILAYEETPLGPLCLRRRELLSQPNTFVNEVTLNHEFLDEQLQHRFGACDFDIGRSRFMAAET